MKFESNANDEVPQESQSDNRDDDFEFVELGQLLKEVPQKSWHIIKQVSSYIMIDLGGYDAFDKFAQWCIRNPNLALFVSLMALIMLFPFLIIMGICISTVAMTFAGLLVLEGTMLTILSMFLFGTLGVLAIILSFFAIVVISGYLGFSNIYDMYASGDVTNARSALMKFLRKERNSPKPKDDEHAPTNQRQDQPKSAIASH